MDEMYPNDGEYFLPRESEERIRKRQVAKSKTQAAKDFIEAEIARLEKQVAFYNTFDSIPDNVLNDGQALGFRILANKQTAANLRQEITHLKGELKNL